MQDSRCTPQGLCALSQQLWKKFQNLEVNQHKTLQQKHISSCKSYRHSCVVSCCVVIKAKKNKKSVCGQIVWTENTQKSPDPFLFPWHQSPINTPLSPCARRRGERKRGKEKAQHFSQQHTSFLLNRKHLPGQKSASNLVLWCVSPLGHELHASVSEDTTLMLAINHWST